ncbi:MAG TPA: heparan-alpha-glucosaminide N-acetyltransferase domain-containing protein, partial [Ramlibacter sp.]|nr:heparan-alpha-glucosaminide N-acetyltransferase domain-containing protein [Ramlibacter sp.]
GWRPAALWAAGALAIAAPLAAPAVHAAWPGLEMLNGPLFNWLGWISRKPVTEDYVPLLPWLGVMWWGVAAGGWALRARPGWLQGPIALSLRPLAWMGRWSLSWYMVHQPVLIGAVMLAGWLAA